MSPDQLQTEMEAEDGLSLDDHNTTAFNKSFLGNKSLLRPADEREFEDELEYGANVRLPDRLAKYKFLSSFATSGWNKYVG